MKEMPLPLTVSAINTFGLSVIPVSFANTCSRAAKSCPSQRSTCQPKILNFDSRSPRSMMCLRALSDWNLLKSTMTIRLLTFWCAAVCKDSQICPSCSSPSPVITITRPPAPFARLAQAIPLALEIPIPSDPELASIPAMLTSG